MLYDGSAGTGYWEDTYSRLSQPLLLGLEAEAVDVSGDYSLEGYDLLYPDESIISSANAKNLRDEITAFVEAGGGLFLTNGFYDFSTSPSSARRASTSSRTTPIICSTPRSRTTSRSCRR